MSQEDAESQGAYMRGRQAFREGRGEDDSPYAGRLREAWELGWHDARERYVRASDCEYLLSVIDTLVEATGEHIDPDDQAIVAQIRADLKSQ